jgi:hypothetical protein
MKRLFAPTATLVLVASVMLTPPVAAGGWATISVVGPSSAPVAGEPWLLELEVLQHGVTPIDWEQVSLVGRNPVSGMVAAANARSDGAVGRYLVEVVFPDAGVWTLDFGLKQLAAEADQTTVSVGEMRTHKTASLALPDAESVACD